MISETLRTLRTELGFSQNYVAEELNISSQSISKWERGEALPSIEYLPKLAEIFHCKIDNLFDKFPYEKLKEDVFFSILKNDKTNSSLEKAKALFQNNSLLEAFLSQLNDLLHSKKYLFANELVETFNFGYQRSQKLIEDLTDLGILIIIKGEDFGRFIVKEKLELFEKILFF
jgi:transcriptional regulator with XRE-family HTH domain